MHDRGVGGDPDEHGADIFLGHTEDILPSTGTTTPVYPGGITCRKHVNRTSSMMFINGAGRSCAISSRQLVCDHAWGQHQLMTGINSELSKGGSRGIAQW